MITEEFLRKLFQKIGGNFGKILRTLGFCRNCKIKTKKLENSPYQNFQKKFGKIYRNVENIFRKSWNKFLKNLKNFWNARKDIKISWKIFWEILKKSEANVGRNYLEIYRGVYKNGKIKIPVFFQTFLHFLFCEVGYRRNITP